MNKHAGIFIYVEIKWCGKNACK